MHFFNFLEQTFTVLVRLVLPLITSKWSKYKIDVPNDLGVSDIASSL
jgi:hypothetical protein